MINGKATIAKLPEQDFRHVINCTPLFSIDLIVIDAGRVLLGQRLNRPAKGAWFVPGGRVRKNETLEDAFARLAVEEIGVQLSYSEARGIGVFEHFYSDSYFDETVSTHYIALGMCLQLSKHISHFPKVQHSAFQWWPIQDAISAPSVHKNTKSYLHKILKG